MSLFKKLFGGTTSPTESNAAANEAIKQQPKQFKTLNFGRYTDCNKTSINFAIGMMPIPL